MKKERKGNTKHTTLFLIQGIFFYINVLTISDPPSPLPEIQISPRLPFFG
jgi:hypothetical protein